MTHPSLPRMRACLSCLIFLLIGDMVCAQAPAAEFLQVEPTFIDAGKGHFRKNIRPTRRKHMTGQITVSYATLKELVDKAAPTDEFVFSIVGIDKKDKEDQRVWGQVLHAADISPYNRHQALIFGFRAPIPKADSKQGSGGAPQFFAGSYYAMGSLCPPPVCPGY